MKKWGILVLALVIGVVSVGCSKSQASEVNLAAENMSYLPKEVTVATGKPIKLVFDNKDVLEHDFSIDKIPAKVGEGHGGGHDMGGKQPDVHVSANAGTKADIEFTPLQAGTYTFYCTIPGHKDAGMVGSLIVK